MLRALATTLVGLAVLSSCATFRALPDDLDFELAADEGILIVHTATDVPVASIAVDGEPVATNLHSGVRYELIIAKAGNYRWTQIQLDSRPQSDGSYWRSRFTMIDRRNYWHFRVEPGVINYPGQVEIYLNQGSGSVTARLANRSGLMWIILRERFPELIARHPVVYTGAVRDDYFKRVAGDSSAQSRAVAE